LTNGKFAGGVFREKIAKDDFVRSTGCQVVPHKYAHSIHARLKFLSDTHAVFEKLVSPGVHHLRPKFSPRSGRMKIAQRFIAGNTGDYDP
jgi:hypothetical protein